MALRDGMLFGMGNPLLDMQCVADEQLLKKYNLKANDAILAAAEHASLFEELKPRKDLEYIPGGATQNSMRVAQWVLKRPNTTTFMGSVGKDDYAKILAEKARAAGVNVHYQETDSIKTGTCAVLVTGSNRSLVADLAAANEYKIEHLQQPANLKLMESADFYYISGFFLTVCPPAIMQVAKHANANNKLFAMNLSAPFICQFFKDPQIAALEYCDIIFGNETEAAEFAKTHNLGTTDIAEIAQKLAAWPSKSKGARLACITQGKDEVICAQNGQVRKYPVEPMTPQQLVDTNGAGDAFVGGYLAQLIQGKDEAECVKCGLYAARSIIQCSGCTLPATCNY